MNDELGDCEDIVAFRYASRKIHTDFERNPQDRGFGLSYT